MIKFYSSFSNLPLSFEDSVFNKLMTNQPLWMLPRVGKYNKDITHSFDKILEGFLKTISAEVILKESTAKRDELVKELDEKKYLDPEKSAMLNGTDRFFIVRGCKVGNFKFKAHIFLKNALITLPTEPNVAITMGINIVVVDVEKKDHVTPDKPTVLSKKSMERDFNKSRSTASTRSIDETTKKILAEKKLNRKL